MTRALFLIILSCLTMSTVMAQVPVGRHPTLHKVAEVAGAGSVSADRRFVLYTDWRTLSINVRDLATGEDRCLIDGWFPIISPDGKRVAYAAWNNGGFEGGELH